MTAVARAGADVQRRQTAGGENHPHLLSCHLGIILAYIKERAPGVGMGGGKQILNLRHIGR